MVEFRGAVNIDDRGEVVCFCSQMEILQGKCPCQLEEDCPEAVINIEIISGTRPSEKKVKKVSINVDKIIKDATKIKEGLSQLESAIKKSKFRI